MTIALATPRSAERVYVGGRFVSGDGRAAFAVTEKATGDVLARACEASAVDVDEAVSAARAAQVEWERRTPASRAQLLRTAAGELRERRGVFEEWLVREGGGIRGKASSEVDFSIGELENAAHLAETTTGELIPSEVPGRVNLIERRAVGTIALITAFNFPLHLAMRILAPAVALGNVVLLKPAPLTSFSGGLLIAELFDDVGFPAGLLSVLPGDAPGPALVAHPGVDMVHFTGSNPVGRRIAVAAAGTLKKVALELGGNNASVVFADADLEVAAKAAADAGFAHQGQVCIATSRHIVMREVADEYEQCLVEHARKLKVGDPATDDVDIGPLISARQRDHVDAVVQGSVERGARLVEGGSFENLFYRPTVLSEVTPGMPAFDEELFGPVAPITIVDGTEEALELLNLPDFALSAAVFSRDLDRAWAFAERVRAGMVHVNDPTALWEPQVPFGGVGASGLGERLSGRANVDLLTERRWLSIRRLVS